MLLMLPLIADSAAFLLENVCQPFNVDTFSACFFATMLRLIADPAAVFLFMMLLTADSTASSLKNGCQP